MSKSAYVDKVLKSYSDPEVLKGEEIEKVSKQALEIAEEEGKTFSKISTSLVYKRIKRLMKQGVWKLSEKAEVPPAEEPNIIVHPAELIEVPSEEPAEPPVEEPSEKSEKKELPETRLIKPPAEEPPEEEESPQITADNVTGTLNLFLGKLEKFTGWEGWKLTEEEAEQWSPSCAYMLNKYMPDFMALYIPEIMFAGLTITVFGSKVALYKQAKAEEEKEKVEPEDSKTKKSEKETPPEKTREEKEAPFKKKVAEKL